MIDPLKEDLIWPTEATKLYPRGPGGKKRHVSQVYRDMKVGHRGIVLESIRTPKLATSREAVARFFHRLTEASGPAQPAPRSQAGRERSDRDVERELDRLGF